MADKFGRYSDRRDTKDFSWSDLFRSFWFLLDKARWKWLFLSLLVFTVQFYVIVPSFMVGKMVDLFTVYKPGDSLRLFYIYTFTLGTSFILVSFVRLSLKRTIGNLMSDVMYETKVKGFEKLLDFSLAWHLDENAGAKAQRIKNGADSLKALYQKLNGEIMRSVASIIGVVIVFSFIQVKYALFFIIYVTGFWIILLSFNRRVQKENDAFFSSLEKAGGSYVEGLSNILTIKTLGAGKDFKKHIASKEGTTRDHENTLRRIKINMWKCYHAFNGLCYGMFLFLVGKDVVAGLVTAGAMVIFYGYMQRVVENSNDMIEVYDIVLEAKSAVGRMMGIFTAKPTITAGQSLLPSDWKSIDINHLDFSYRESQVVKESSAPATLQDVTITIPRFAKIGIVGKTGSGKSTFAKILAGLYSPSQGSYTIGGLSFYDLTHEEQTHQVTLVLQETEVFNLSLRDNITLMRDIDDETVKKALRIAQLSDVVAKLPMGLDTLVGERGYYLSGGERQRVGIARAICKNSPIIILDEATSSVDSRTELFIQQALEKELADRTIISIAHRVSTLENCDMVYVFEEGRIAEMGKFVSLMDDSSSKFFALNKVKKVS
ncbi:MAG: ABC transporter ATP-binding protein [Patescibacteria group bacterium]